jgi:hypothetical protein
MMKLIITTMALLFLGLFVIGQADPIQDNNNSYQNAQMKSSQAIKHGIDSLIIQVWDESTSQWNVAYKELFTYDANGNMIQSDGYGWEESTSEWFVADESEFTYDVHGNMTQSVESYWDGFSSKWVNQYKHEYTYNANGGRTQSTGYRWDESTSDWVPIDKLEYTYDASDHITQSLYYCWDEGTSKFVNCWKEEYTCDEKGNIIENHQYEWDEGTDYLFGKYEYTYDTSYARSDLFLPYFNDDISIIETMDIHELFNHKMNSFLGSAWDEASEDWIPNLKGDYFYSEQNVSAVNETEEEISRIYPNPCSDYIAFSFSDNFHQITLKLFDLQGRKLLTRAFKNHEIIRLEGLENGIYVYELLTSDGKIQSGRLIKL